MPDQAGTQRLALERDGYVLLPGALSPEFMAQYREALRTHFYRRTDPSGVPVVRFEADSLGRLPSTRILLEQTALFDSVADILGYRPGYCHHSDVQLGRPAGWHRDSINKGLYFDFCQTEIFDTQDYAVYKICIYCQDHQKGGGLSVIPGSHVADGPPDESRGLSIRSRLGDVILFDTRLYHRGIASSQARRSDVDRMSCFMTLARDNAISREFVNGTIWRQNRQLRRPSYELTDDLAAVLERVGLPVVPYENSPAPSLGSVLDELEAARKQLKVLQKENARLSQRTSSVTSQAKSWLSPLRRLIPNGGGGR